MTSDRRDFALLLAAAASAQAAEPAALPSATFRFEDLPVRQSAQNRSRAVLNGKTSTGFGIEMHQTEIAPGMAPHAPHKHAHEELVMVREGILEVTIEGKASKLGPGGCAYVASNEMHGWKNVSEVPCHYFVLTLNRKSLA